MQIDIAGAALGLTAAPAPLGHLRSEIQVRFTRSKAVALMISGQIAHAWLTLPMACGGLAQKALGIVDTRCCFAPSQRGA